MPKVETPGRYPLHQCRKKPLLSQPTSNRQEGLHPRKGTGTVYHGPLPKIKEETIVINQNDLAIMDAMMAAMTQADAWTDRLSSDPGIAAAESRWDKALEAARPHLPAAVYMELSGARGCALSAYSDAGILYGLHLAITLREMALQPVDLSRYWLKKAHTGKTPA